MMTSELPAAAGPELITHEWAADGRCLSPESIAIDFGKAAGHRKAVVLLGLWSDGTWRRGYQYCDKKGLISSEDGVFSHKESFTSRRGALGIALAHLATLFQGDKFAIATLEKFFDTTQAIAAEGSPANKPSAPGAALPPSRPGLVPLRLIEPNPEQPRKAFAALPLQDLATAIASVGLLHPIGVRRLLPAELGELPDMPAAERYEIIYGERRYRAHQILKRETIACTIYEGITRAQGAAAALIENLQSEDLNPIEQAEGFRDLMAAEGLTQEQCAARVGMSRPVVANALRVLKLPEKVLALIREGPLTLAHGVALARFAAWPNVVEVLAEESVRGKTSASVLEKGVPFTSALLKAEVGVSCHMHEVDNEFPDEIKKHPSYWKINDWNYFCFEPTHWREIVAAHEAAKTSEREAAAAKREKQLAALMKSPSKIKSLDQLPASTYVRVQEEDQSLLALLPAESTRELATQDGGSVTICTEMDLFKRVAAEMAAAKKADRRAKLAKLFGAALHAVASLKKLGGREMYLLLYLGGSQEVMRRPGYSERAAKRSGIKVPAKAMNPDYDGEMIFSTEAFAALAAGSDALQLYKVLITDWLMQLEDDAVDSEYDISVDGDVGCLLRWILDKKDLGLLEETKAGQKQLLEMVKSAVGNAEAPAAKRKAGK